MKSLSCVQLFATPLTVAYQAPLSVEFSRPEYWSGLLCPPPGDLPDPGIGPRSPALQADSLPSEPPGKPMVCCDSCTNLYPIFLWCSELLRPLSETGIWSVDPEETFNILRKHITVERGWLKHALMWGGGSGCVYFTLEQISPATMVEIIRVGP